jgi:protein-S-isoprenylcysteine O-methyltransferase Ste14
MQATAWEFRNRGLLIGLMFAVSFPLYTLDPQNVTAAIATRLAPLLHVNDDHLARLLFVLAALLISIAAFIRTWASAYLRADVVYAANVKTAFLVADGPYRRVRNPLYLGNVLMGIGMASMCSRVGAVVLIFLMFLFNYRLIFREESELAAAIASNASSSSSNQGVPASATTYTDYLRLVPRLFPALTPSIPSAGSQPNWSAGFKVESWYWGFALSVWAFAATLKPLPFFLILGASLVLFFLVASQQEKKPSQPAP